MPAYFPRNRYPHVPARTRTRTYMMHKNTFPGAQFNVPNLCHQSGKCVSGLQDVSLKLCVIWAGGDCSSPQVIASQIHLKKPPESIVSATCIHRSKSQKSSAIAKPFRGGASRISVRGRTHARSYIYRIPHLYITQLCFNRGCK